MKRIGLPAALIALLCLVVVDTANGTIDTIKGTLVCFIGCGKNVVQFVARDREHAFEVVGQFVDLSTAVEMADRNSGVTPTYGTRKPGSRSSIIVKFDVRPNATLGEHTVRMRYAVETSGPDSFKIRVVRRGTVSRIQYRRPLPPGGPAADELVAPMNLPLNEPVVLVLTGTQLDGFQVKPHSGFRSVRVLPGATETQASIQVEFSQSGQGPLLLFDSALSAQDMNSSASSHFLYGGGANLNIQYGGTPSGRGNIVVAPPITGGAGAAPAVFVDVAPRANMLNIFRRQGQAPVFTDKGVEYFAVDTINAPQFCNGMTGNQTRVITVPNPVWGVSNVGTANITTAFESQLRSGNDILATQTVTTLNAGQTNNFTFARPESRLRVFTFLTRNGCFVAPTATPFFEDPPFTVVVNTNGALTEAAANQANNSRRF